MSEGYGSRYDAKEDRKAEKLPAAVLPPAPAAQSAIELIAFTALNEQIDRMLTIIERQAGNISGLLASIDQLAARLGAAESQIQRLISGPGEKL